MREKKQIPLIWIAGAILALILLCIGLYFIGFLDVFIIFVLIPGAILGILAGFFVVLIGVLRLKREKKSIPAAKIAALLVLGLISVVVMIPIVLLILIFNGIIPLM